MTRGGYGNGGIALAVFVCAGLLALPAAVGAQSAVDEYTLDIPGGGSPSGDSGGPPAAGTAGSGSASSSEGGRSGQDVSGGTAADSEGGRARGAGGAGAKSGAAGLAPLHQGAGQPTDTDDRNAPEVVADALLDDAMLPMLGALVLISGIGAWRLLRHRHTPTGAAG